MQWYASWTQAMIDFGVMEKTFTDVTLRMTPVASIGGERLRLEFDNRFGSTPIEIDHVAVTVGDSVVDAAFGGALAISIPVGGSVWTDPIEVRVRRSDDVVIDVHFPGRARYSTGNVWGAPFRLSEPGDFAGVADFPGGELEQLPVPDGTTVPLSAPLLRTLEVDGALADAVVVCLGDSITVAGWPQLAAALLDDESTVAVVNRGIAGNRLRFDPVPAAAMFGRSGLHRFDEDVVGTAGVSHVVVALGTNDLGHPGTMAPIEELPTTADLIAAYTDVIARAEAAGIAVIMGTIPPFLPATGYDEAREAVRGEVNEWIRGSATASVDFDAALRSDAHPSRLADEFDSGDHLHPNADGQARMARAMVDTIIRLQIGAHA